MIRCGTDRRRRGFSPPTPRRSPRERASPPCRDRPRHRQSRLLFDAHPRWLTRTTKRRGLVVQQHQPSRRLPPHTPKPHRKRNACAVAVNWNDGGHTRTREHAQPMTMTMIVAPTRRRRWTASPRVLRMMPCSAYRRFTLHAPRGVGLCPRAVEGGAVVSMARARALTQAIQRRAGLKNEMTLLMTSALHSPWRWLAAQLLLRRKRDVRHSASTPTFTKHGGIQHDFSLRLARRRFGERTFSHDAPYSGGGDASRSRGTSIV